MGEADGDGDGMVLASEMYASGVEALEDREFVEAADYLAQCLQFHAERSGDTSIEAAVIGLKYAEALLGCARMKGTNVLGTMKKPDPTGASTSKGPPPADDTAQGQGEDDLQLAWEVAETTRLGFEQHAGAPEVEEEHIGEVHELLGEIGAEMENFPQAVTDYETAIEVVSKLEQRDVRWEAEMHFKISVALELADRVDEAVKHVSIAQSQLKELVKEKEAAWQELLQSRKEADTTEAPMPSGSGAGAPVTPAAAPRIAGQSERCSMAVSADAAGGAVAAAAVQADGGNGVAAEDGEAVALEEDVKSLRKVIADLAERAQELQALQEQSQARLQESVIKEQIKAAIGLPPAPADGAGPSRAAADAPAKADDADGAVQDLGVITGKRKRKDENDAPEAQVNEVRRKEDAAVTKSADGNESVCNAADT